MALRLRDKLKHVPAPTAGKGSDHGAGAGTGAGAHPGTPAMRDAGAGAGISAAAMRSAIGERMQLPSDTPAVGDDRIHKLRALIGDVVERDRRRQQTGRSRHGAGGGQPQPLTVGELRDTPHGPLHVIERWLDPDHCHGRVPVRGALGASAAMLARLSLDPELEGLDLSRMLIFDTETTGLAGGAGTVPFLIGLAFFEDGVLKVEQLFLPNFGAEAPMLHHLSQRMAQASCLVSYNGKSFDWPLLRARFVMNRVPVAQPPPHVDLLHCARRVLKLRVGDVESRMESVKLTAVEREVLGFHREDDVDGALIPGLYLGYLRGADPQTMLGVLEHNDNDVVALAAILGHLCERFERLAEEDDPRDHLAYARVALRAQDLERAEGFAAAAARGGGAAALTAEAHALTAAVARKRGDAGSAASAWLRALEAAPCEHSAAEVHFALAKLYEHQLKDPLSAHRHARWTLPIEGPEAHGRRLGRLRRRLERTW